MVWRTKRSQSCAWRTNFFLDSLWLSATLEYPQCIFRGSTAVLALSHWYLSTVFLQSVNCVCTVMKSCKKNGRNLQFCRYWARMKYILKLYFHKNDFTHGSWLKPLRPGDPNLIIGSDNYDCHQDIFSTCDDLLLIGPHEKKKLYQNGLCTLQWKCQIDVIFFTDCKKVHLKMSAVMFWP